MDKAHPHTALLDMVPDLPNLVIDFLPSSFPQQSLVELLQNGI